jgi:transcriptional regulator with XRE-family HTH domain
LDPREFGVYFSKLREASGFKSQRELADRSGVSHSTINRIEAGTHKPSPQTLRIVAGVLRGASYEDFMNKVGYIDRPFSPDTWEKLTMKIGDVADIEYFKDSPYKDLVMALFEFIEFYFTRPQFIKDAIPQFRIDVSKSDFIFDVDKFLGDPETEIFNVLDDLKAHMQFNLNINTTPQLYPKIDQINQEGNISKESSTYSVNLKMKFFQELERDLGIDLSDPDVQKMLKRAAKVIFTDKD